LKHTEFTMKKLKLILILIFLLGFAGQSWADVDIMVRATNPFEKKVENYAVMSSVKQLQVDKLDGIGDIVQVFPAGKLDVRYAHAGGKFYIFRVIGIDIKDAKALETSLASGETVISERKWFVNFDLLPEVIKTQVLKEFFTEIKLEDFSKALTAKVNAKDNYKQEVSAIKVGYYYLKHYIDVVLQKIIPSAFAGADIVRYLNPGSTGGNGTTSELSGANAAFATMQAAESAGDDNGNLVTQTCNYILYCAGTTAGTAACSWDGWTTGPTYQIKIIGDNNLPYYNASHYRMEVSIGSSGGILLEIAEEYVTVKNIQFTLSTSGAYNAYTIRATINNATSFITIKNCIFKSGTFGGAGTCYGITSASGSSNVMLIQYNLIYGFKNGTLGYGMNISSQNGSPDVAYIYNNTLYGNYQGIFGTATYTTITAKNNIVIGSGNTNAYSGTFADSGYNLTDGTDNTDDGGLNHSILSADPLFTNAATEDFTLLPSSPAITRGTDVYTGTASVIDMAGYAITDGAGVLNPKLTIKGISIGAYQRQWAKNIFPLGIALARWK
jgi:hypothetical protein